MQMCVFHFIPIPESLIFGVLWGGGGGGGGRGGSNRYTVSIEAMMLRKALL